MSDLVVLDFDGVGTADEVLTKLRGLQKEHLIDLEDACVVVHTEAGKVQVKQAVNLTKLGAATGASTAGPPASACGMVVNWIDGSTGGEPQEVANRHAYDDIASASAVRR